MHPHFYLVSFLKWVWKCVLTDCLQHKGANVQKWSHSPPFRKQWKIKTQTLFCHQRQKLPWQLPNTPGPRWNCLFSSVTTFGEQCCRPRVPPSFPSGLSCRAFRGTFTWSNVHGHSYAAPFMDWIESGLVVSA